MVGAMASLFSASAANGANIHLQNVANKANRDLMREQNQFEVAQWERQNSYNSPIAQMSRLKAAGLNPDLMYGQGSPGNAPEQAHATYTPQMKAAQVSPLDIQSNVQSAQIFKEQMRGLAADNRIKEANAIKAEIDAENYSTEKDYNLGILDTTLSNLGVELQNNRWYLEQWPLRKQILEQDFRRAASLADMTEEQWIEQQIINMYLPAQLEGNLEEQQSRIANLDQETKWKIQLTQQVIFANKQEGFKSQFYEKMAWFEYNIKELESSKANKERWFMKRENQVQILEMLRSMRVSQVDVAKIERMMNDAGDDLSRWQKIVLTLEELFGAVGRLFSGSVMYGVGAGSTNAPSVKGITLDGNNVTSSGGSSFRYGMKK